MLFPAVILLAPDLSTLQTLSNGLYYVLPKGIQPKNRTVYLYNNKTVFLLMQISAVINQNDRI